PRAYRDKLDDSDFESFANIPLNLRSADAKTRKEAAQSFTNLQSNGDRLLQTARNAKEIPVGSSVAKLNEKELARFAQFQQVAQAKLSELEATKGGKATPGEVQSVIDQLTYETLTKPDTFFGIQYGETETNVFSLDAAEIDAGDVP